MDRIPRPAVAARLARALDDGHLLLVAGAGFGKTMAIEDALALRGGAAAWVRCSELDRDPGRLLADLVASLALAAPGAADVLGERLVTAPLQIDSAVASRELARELERLLVDPLTIVIDDAEQLADVPEASAVVRDLLTSSAPALRVVVAARVALPLRLSKLQVSGRLAQLGPADLAFSPDECAELLQTASGHEPSSEELDALWSATEGWPLGVALSAASGGAPAPGARGSAALVAFLEEEVLLPLGDELRVALLESSLAPDLDAAMLEGLGLPAGLLDEVKRRGVPLRNVDSGARVAYHPLVRDMLRERLVEECSAERMLELHAALAAALDQAQRGPEAVEHWLAAGDSARAAKAVARQGRAIFRSAPATVAAWLEALPPDMRGVPELRNIEGRLAAGEGELERSVGPLTEAIAGYADRGDTEREWRMRVLLSDVLAQLEDYDRSAPLAEGFDDVNAIGAPMTAVSVACNHARASRFDEAAALFDRAMAHPLGAPLVTLAAGFQGAFLDFPQSRLDGAVAGLREVVGALERFDPSNRLSLFLGYGALIHDERGEDDAAVEMAERMVRLTERSWMSSYVSGLAHTFKAGMHARHGHFAEAELELGRVRPLVRNWRAENYVARAMLAAGRGDHEGASEAAAAAIEHGALNTWLGRARLTSMLVPVLVDAGQPSWARELLDSGLQACPPECRAPRMYAQRAWLRRNEGDDPGALEDLVAAWHQADSEAQHLVRREWRWLEPLLWTALEQETLPPDEVIAAIEAALPGGAALLPFTRHPVAEVRRAALVSAVGSGHPESPRVVAELERDADEGVAAAARASGRRLASEPPPLVFTLLGGFGLRRGSFTVTEEAWERRVAQRLVRLLLVRRDTPVPEDLLFEAFWPDKAADAARRGLQVAVSSARAVLDPPGAEHTTIEVLERSYRLRLRAGDSVDVDEFERAAQTALAADGPERLTLLEIAATRWGGEPLPEDRYEDWAIAWREGLLDLYGQVLGALSDGHAAAGDHARAIEASRKAVEVDPLDEGAHRRLMLSYARSGRRGHALRQFLACRRALVDGIGVEPAEETAALQRQILAGEAV
ncbi:MAG TPA: BTAD domain-containing putative transcriptional regulator [Thermoleophilaceae bacterium]|jgi:DNA-binding SARP family transcriptional activator